MRLNSEIYTDVWNAYSHHWPDKQLFDAHYLNAIYNTFDVRKSINGGQLEIVNVIGTEMQKLLTNYAKSTPKTKGGKIGRFFAKIFSKIDIQKLANYILTSNKKIHGGK